MRLLIVGDSPALASGQARMVRELAGRFAAECEVLVAGWFHELARPDFVAPYGILPVAKKEPETLAPLLAQAAPDVILAIGDPWEFKWLAEQRAAGAPWVLCGYFNVEMAELPGECEVTLDAFDAVRTTSEAGAQAIDRPGVTAVHLGVQADQYPPAPQPQRILGHLIEDRAVVFVNAQNTHRKNISAAVTGMSLAADKLELLGVINAAPKHPEGFDLVDAIVRADAERYIKCNLANRGPQDTVSDQSVAEFYRAADILLVTSSAEGFCLPVLEAMASRTLVIAPRHSSLPELVGSDRGILYPPGSPIPTERGSAWLVDPEEVAAAIIQGIELLESDEGEALLTRAQAYAQAHTWEKTFTAIADMVGTTKQQPKWPVGGARAGQGQPFDPLLRIRARQRATPDRMAVVKLGGLGDMLMATRVIRAAFERWQKRVVVFANEFLDVFRALGEVDEVVEIFPTSQDSVVAAVGDQFPICLDLRMVSRVYGAGDATDFAQTYAWHTDRWTWSLSRASDLELHATRVMLKSLGLPEAPITPIYTPRAPVLVPPQATVIAPGTGTLGALKQPLPGWWGQLIKAMPGPVFQIGALGDALLDGALDARGWKLPQTATLLAEADRVVLVESGLAHLCRAVRSTGKRPPVVLFGPTPVVTYGYPEHVNLSSYGCRPCFWGVLWGQQQCALGVPQCVNLPGVETVVQTLQC